MSRLFVKVFAGLLIAAILVAVVWTRTTKSADAWVEKGLEAADRRDWVAAESAFEQAVTVSPDHVRAWTQLAEIASKTDHPDRSQEALSHVARLAPEQAAKLGLQLGGYWMAHNRIRPAIQALRLSTQASPSSPEPWRLLAQIYGVTAHRNDVVNCLIELIKRHAFTRDDLIFLSSINPVLDDPERLKRLLKADPSDKSALLPDVMRELDRNQIQAAWKSLDEIVQSQPDDLEAQSLMGEVCADFLPDKFLHWNSHLPSTAENEGGIWLARGKWLNNRGQAPEAVRCLHEAVSRLPEDLSANVQLGQLLKALGKTDLGNAFTERGRRLQRIIDLSARMKEPRADEYIAPMIEELEATGRLWEAWAWCVVYEQSSLPDQTPVAIRKESIARRLNPKLPRTIPGSLPGADVDWTQYPLPDWSNQKSDSRTSSQPQLSDSSSIHFEDVARKVGLDFQYVKADSGKDGRKIYETMGGGVAVLDFDQDGWPDLYFAQGRQHPVDGPDDASDALYRNRAGQRFQPVTNAAGIHETRFSQGVTAGDYDNDGFPDLYVANLGLNRLYHNNGDGTFRDVTSEAGLKQSLWTVSCAIADLNGDGMPELFDVNYVQGNDLLTAVCYDEHRRPVVCRPTVFDPAPDTVSFNLGDGRFQEQQAEAGLDLPLGMGLGLVIADFNADDRPDIFIANDMTANYLLINETMGPGQPLRFKDEAFQRGVALDANGLAQACMGIACEDVNRDGQPDLFVTNFARESNTLYLSQPGGLYQDMTQSAGLREPSFDPLGFGTQFLDADNDGWFDLVVMNGHIDEFVNEPFRMKAQFFQGQSDGRWKELTARTAGLLFDEARLARGLALLDWNRDGRVDFVATDLERPPLLAENGGATMASPVQLRLIGTESSRDAVGAKLTVQFATYEQHYQLKAGDGYQSRNEHAIYIHTVATNPIVGCDIQWPSGRKSHYNGLHNLHEGSPNVSLVCWLAIEGDTSLVVCPVQ